MEQIDSVSFSSFIAGMLLMKRDLTSTEIVNAISRFGYDGTVVDDDDIEGLSSCVEMDRDCCFRLKDGFYYETILESGIMVVDFLKEHTNTKVLSFLQQDVVYKNFYDSNIFGSSIMNCSEHENSVEKFIDVSRKYKRKIRGIGRLSFSPFLR